MLQNALGTGNFQSTVLAVVEAEAVQVRIHFHLYYYWLMLVVIVVGQGVQKDPLSKMKEVAEAIHVHNYNPYIPPPITQLSARGLYIWLE